jgi:aminopeptidase N
MNEVTTTHTYQKGSWILHMLRGVVGTDAFWKGIRSYYSKYMNSNATTADFRREMEEASGISLEIFFEQWLYKPGALQYSGSWQYNGKRREITVTLDQTQRETLFSMPVQIAVNFPNQEPLLRILQIRERHNEFVFGVDMAPVDVVLDPGNWVLMDGKWARK